MSTPAARCIRPALVLATTAALYASSCSDAIQVADSGELVTAACGLGVAHPPGYPLYVLAGHLLCKLPISTPAARLSLLSLLCGLWAVGVLYAIVVQMTGHRWSASVAALVLASGPLMWRYSSLAEVFSLHVALSLTLVYCALRCAAAGGAAQQLRWAGWTGLAGGLALGVHHSAVMLAPLALAALIRRPVVVRELLGRLAVASLGVAAGLCCYLQPLAADRDAVPRWGQTETWGGLVHHLLRRDYGTLQLTIDGGGGPLDAPGLYLTTLPAQLGWVLLAPALLGWALLLLRADPRRRIGGLKLPRRDLSLLLGLSPLVCGPLFLLLFNVDTRGIGRQVVERFFLLPDALLCAALGVGLAWIDRVWMTAGQLSRTTLWRTAVWLVVGLGVLMAFPRADVSDSYAVEDYARNALLSAERGALVLGQGDVRLFALTYAQQLLGVRRDVQYVDVGMLLYPWYVEQQRRRFPRFDYSYERGHVDTIKLIHRALRAGVPVYLAYAYNQKVRSAYAVYPAGPLLRIVPVGRTPPRLDTVLRLNRRLFRGFVRRGRDPDPQTDPWSASLREPFARTWHGIALELQRVGREPEAIRARARAERWAPWLTAPRRPPRMPLPVSR